MIERGTDMSAEVSREYAVQMHGITKSFGSFYALTDVDLDVRKGTIHSILGENGAGKSTLMNIQQRYHCVLISRR